MISFLYAILISLVLYGLGVDVGGYRPKSMTERISVMILLAPPIETLIFQAIPYAITGIFKKGLHRWFLHCYIIASSLFFAFSHSYSNGYVLTMYFPGIILAYCYARSKEQNRPAFTTTMLVHLLYNGLALLWNYYLAGI
ncbi:CPBP family glutamic-type intramembrane protease [Chitinophaga flava]|uniref:CPBP family glutamic-type intramembrane protease n=1 Tax=Chitinophaga flava TaxID=2259036 RepID=UPI00137959C6|nr:CPBP family glutamic-type intramembrane protease [Chitinophaga flava]